MSEPVASAKGIVKRFAEGARPALDGVDILVEPGRITGLVGPDGAGKTTLIRILAGLIDPDAGDVAIAGVPVTQVDRSELGYMPQRFGLYEDLTVGENLRLHADLQGLPDDERAARFARLLRFTDLGRFVDWLAGKLSGGMKQKLGLACALVGDPRVLLLDEPGVGVDPISRRELWSMARELAADGVGILWSTAYLDEAEKCDRVLLLNDGRAIHEGPPEAFTRDVAGRTFHLPGGGRDRREMLRVALAEHAVQDAVLQGDGIRLMLAGTARMPDWRALGLGDCQPSEVPATFEDAFFDRLGGEAAAASQLASAYRHVDENGDSAIEARDLTKRFGDFTAVSNISFAVERGQIFGLLGPNGAGKSTTFKMLCGLLTPSAGQGAVNGHDLRDARASARQSFGYMSQQFSLYGHLSVRQNLLFFAGAYGLDRNARAAAMDLAISTFALEPFLDTSCGTLPLGFKRRLAFACAILHQPSVIFLDEPTSGVDPLMRREFWAHINGLVERGVSVLVTTHFLEEAEYCDRISLIYRAEQIAAGSPDELRKLAGLPGATMDDVFISLVERSDRERLAA